MAGPAPAAAQHETFVEALVDFTTALSGTFGDEGGEARQALDRLAAGLAEWDRTLAEYESNVAAILPTASPDRALEMHTTMGSLYVARGRLADALREFDAAAGLAPGRPLLHILRALVHDAAGAPGEALQALRTASELDPTDPVAAYMLAARALEAPEAARPDAALTVLSGTVDRIAAREFSWRPAPFIGTALLPDDATPAALFVPALYREAFELFDRAEYAMAVDAMRAAASRDPLLAGKAAPMLQGSSALRQGRVADAIAHFTAATREAPGAEAHRMLGIAHWLAAEYEPGIEQLEEAVRLAPDDERARLTLAQVLEEIGQDERADRVLAETVAALPSSSLARWRLGRRYASANRTVDALRQMELAVGGGVLTGEGALQLEIGALHRRDLDTRKAAAAFGRAVALRPNDRVAHRELGRTLLQLGRTDAALAELAASLIVDPNDLEACVTLGQMYLDADRHADAARILAYAVSLSPDHAESHYALATALIRSGRREDAAPHLEAFQRLQQQAIEDQRRRIDLSVLKLEAGVRSEDQDFARAAVLWARLVVEQPDAAANHAGLAAARAGLGQLEDAVAHYEKALALGAEPLVYQQLAALYEQMGRSDDSARTRARLATAQQEALDAAGANR